MRFSYTLCTILQTVAARLVSNDKWRRCRRLVALPKPSLLQPLGPVLPLLGMLLCWGQAVWNLLLGAAIMVLVIKFAVRAQLLTSSGAQKPITRILLGLGVACGAAG